MLADAVDEGLKRAHGEDGCRAAVFQLVEHLALLVERVEGGDDATGEKRAVEGDEVLRAVGGKDRDAIALFDASVLQIAAEAPAGGPGLAERVRISLGGYERGLVAKALR